MRIEVRRRRGCPQEPRGITWPVGGGASVSELGLAGIRRTSGWLMWYIFPASFHCCDPWCDTRTGMWERMLDCTRIAESVAGRSHRAHMSYLGAEAFPIWAYIRSEIYIPDIYPRLYVTPKSPSITYSLPGPHLSSAVEFIYLTGHNPIIPSLHPKWLTSILHPIQDIIAQTTSSSSNSSNNSITSTPRLVPVSCTHNSSSAHTIPGRAMAAQKITTINLRLPQSPQSNRQNQRANPRLPFSLNSTRASNTRPTELPLTRLNSLLERPENHHMIRWDPAGEHIIVERPEQLALHVLPSIYRQSRFASFSRQLNVCLLMPLLASHSNLQGL